MVTAVVHTPRVVLVGMLTLGALSAVDASAAATPAPESKRATIGWTRVASGTSEDISAIEYQSSTRMWFTTRTGSIFTRQADGGFVRTRVGTGTALNDIEFQAGGQVGFAVGDAGQVYRSADGGATWSGSLGPGILLSRKGTTFVDCRAGEPLGNVRAVRFAGTSRVWLLGEGAQIARSDSTPTAVGSPGTWVDANRDTRGTPSTADDSCRVESTYADGYTDAYFLPSSPDIGHIVAQSFAQVFATTDNLMSGAAKRPASAGAGGSALRKLAGDPTNPNRMWSVAPEPTGLAATAYTADGFQTATPWRITTSSTRALAPLQDIDHAGGTVLAVGNDGVILNSVDGLTFRHIGVTGTLARTPWRAVGLASTTDAAIGGVGGVLAISTTANGTPYVAPRRSPWRITFTGRGNQLRATTARRTVRVVIRGAVRRPAGVAARSICTGVVRVTVQKRRAVIARATVRPKVRNGACRIARTVTVKRTKVGKTKRLRVSLAYRGNARLLPGKVTRPVRVRRMSPAAPP